MSKVLFSDRELFGTHTEMYKFHCAANILKIYYGFKECYTANITYDITAYDYINDLSVKNKVDTYIKNCCKSTLHKTPLEHVSVTFEITDVSRTCSHQNVRHRIASFNQKSQRYIDETNYDVVVPPRICANEKTSKLFDDLVATVKETYKTYREEGIPKEDARFVLLEATTTHYQMTMNFSSLINFLGLRLCKRAQWEIRGVADEILEYLKQDYEPIFQNIGPSCEQLGYCPEGKNSCGYKPTKEEVFRVYNERKENK